MSRSGALKKISQRIHSGSIKFEIAAVRVPSYAKQRKGQRFQACVKIGGRGRRAHSSWSCMLGSNPRTALAAALRSLAKSKIGSRRKGAFKGSR